MNHYDVETIKEKKIELIKFVREVAPIGLVDSKNLVEYFIANYHSCEGVESYATYICKFFAKLAKFANMVYKGDIVYENDSYVIIKKIEYNVNE